MSAWCGLYSIFSVVSKFFRKILIIPNLPYGQRNKADFENAFVKRIQDEDQSRMDAMRKIWKKLKHTHG